MRGGVCRLIYALSTAKINIDSNMQKHLFVTIVENLKHPNQDVQNEATKALHTYCNAYLGGKDVKSEDAVMQEFANLFEPSQVDQNISVTRGYNMAFGVMSKSMVTAFGNKPFEVLINNCVPKQKENDDAETRKQTVKSLIQLVSLCGISDILPDTRKAILEVMYRCFDDYAVDRRGDVGSWVRQEAMVSLNTYMHTIVTSNDDELKKHIGADQPKFYERFVAMFLQQLNEKIDRIREQAGRSLQRFFKSTVPLLGKLDFAKKDELTCLFLQSISEFGGAMDQDKPQGQNAFQIALETPFEEDVRTLESVFGGKAEKQDNRITFLPWRSAKFVFDSMKPFFDSEAYSMAILKGLITSSGGLTESTMKASQTSLFEYLKAFKLIKKEDGSIDDKEGIVQKKLFIAKFKVLFTENQKNDRVTIPLMKTAEMLLAATYFIEPEVQEDIHVLHEMARAECSKTKSIVKLIAGIGMFSGMMTSPDPELQKKAIKTLLFLLYHNFPKVRQMAAEKLYTGLLTMDEYDQIIPGGEDAFDEANDLLSETNWSDNVKKLTADTKVKMYAYFGHEAKMPTK